MKKKEQVMPIKDLGKYLKSIKQEGIFGSDPVVDMGVIKKENNYLQKSITYIMFFMIIATGMAFTYDAVTTNNIKILINDNPATLTSLDKQSVEHAIETEGGKIISFKKNKDVYEIEIKTKQEKKKFINLLKKNNVFKKIEIINN